MLLDAFASGGGACPGEVVHLCEAGKAECWVEKRKYLACCSVNKLQHSSLPNVEEAFVAVARAAVVEWHVLHIAALHIGVEGHMVELMVVSATIDDALS